MSVRRCTLLPSGSWRAKVYAGKDPLTGREIRFRKTRRTEVEAQIEFGRLLELARAGRNPDSGVTVAELLDAVFAPSLRSPESSITSTPSSCGAVARSASSSSSRRALTRSGSHRDSDKKNCSRCTDRCCAPATGSAPASAVSVLFRSRGASKPARYSRNPRRCANEPKGHQTAPHIPQAVPVPPDTAGVAYPRTPQQVMPLLPAGIAQPAPRSTNYR
jgi:hypothetical protein